MTISELLISLASKSLIIFDEIQKFPKAIANILYVCGYILFNHCNSSLDITLEFLIYWYYRNNNKSELFS